MSSSPKPSLQGEENLLPSAPSAILTQFRQRQGKYNELSLWGKVYLAVVWHWVVVGWVLPPYFLDLMLVNCEFEIDSLKLCTGIGELEICHVLLPLNLSTKDLFWLRIKISMDLSKKEETKEAEMWIWNLKSWLFMGYWHSIQAPWVYFDSEKNINGSVEVVFGWKVDFYSLNGGLYSLRGGLFISPPPSNIKSTYQYLCQKRKLKTKFSAENF